MLPPLKKWDLPRGYKEEGFEWIGKDEERV